MSDIDNLVGAAGEMMKEILVVCFSCRLSASYVVFVKEVHLQFGSDRRGYSRSLGTVTQRRFANVNMDGIPIGLEIVLIVSLEFDYWLFS